MAIKIYKTISVIFGFLILSTIWVACGDPAEELSPEPDFYLSVRIDGVDITVDDATVSLNPDTPGGVYKILAKGFVGDDSRIGINLKSPTSTGIFFHSEPDHYFLYAEGLTTWVAREGTGEGLITIVENNSEFMEGSFSFTGVKPSDNSTRTFTEGYFKARKF